MDVEIGIDSPRSTLDSYDLSDDFIDNASYADSETPLFVQPDESVSPVPDVVQPVRSSGSPVQQVREGGPGRESSTLPPEVANSLTEPGTRLGKPGSFRFAGQRALLTYSQVPNGWDVTPLRDNLELLGATYRIGRELHQDGGVHYHAYVDFGRRFETEDKRRFDIAGHHPNIKCVRRTFMYVWDYAGKDGDIVFCTAERPPPPKSKRSREEDWACIRSASTRDEFFEKGYELATRDFILFGSAVSTYADTRYAPKRPCYAKDGNMDIDWDAVPEIRRFLVESLRNRSNSLSLTEDEAQFLSQPAKPGRVKGLIVYGDTRLGKTELVRSLGKHCYFGGMFDLQEYLDNPDVEFALFDDIDDVKFVPMYKFWLGAQKEFVCSDKYKHKTRVYWSRPSVWVANKSLLEYRDKRGNPSVDVDWLLENCFIQCIEKQVVKFN